VGRLDQMIDWANQAIELLDSATQPADKRAAAERIALIASCHIARGLETEYAQVLRSRLAWYVLEILPRSDARAGRVHGLVTHHYEQAIEAMRDQHGWGMMLTERHLDFAFHVGAKREVYFPFPIAARLQQRLNELQRLNDARLDL